MESNKFRNIALSIIIILLVILVLQNYFTPYGSKEPVVKKNLPTEGLIAYYPFNGNANNEKDQSDHGEVHGVQPTTDRFGNPQSAFLFDGSSAYIQLPRTRTFSLNHDFTVSIWIKHGGFNMNNVQWIVWNGNQDEGGSSYSRSWMLVANQNSRIAFEKYGGGNTWLEGPNVDGNVWTHIVAYVRNDGNTGYLFVNGISYGTRSSGMPFRLDPSTEIIIGKRGGGHDSDYFKGTIDDLRIYNRALTEAEIQQLNIDR